MPCLNYYKRVAWVCPRACTIGISSETDEFDHTADSLPRAGLSCWTGDLGIVFNACHERSTDRKHEFAVTTALPLLCFVNGCVIFPLASHAGARHRFARYICGMDFALIWDSRVDIAMAGSSGCAHDAPPYRSR